MPARAYVFPEHDLLVSRFEGELTGELLLGHYRKLIAIDAESPTRNELVDFRRVTGTDVTPSTLRLVAEPIARNYSEVSGSEVSGSEASGPEASRSETPGSPAPGQLRCAVLAPMDLGYGISRMYEMGSSPAVIDTQVFRKLDDALSWLLETDSATRDELARLLDSPPHDRLLFEV